MSLFQYTAYNQSGRELKGVVNADSLASAKESLIRRKVLITDVRPYANKGRSKLSRQDVLLFTRDLSQLLDASLPLYESLRAICEKMEGQKAHPAIVDITDQIHHGKAFSQALYSYNKSFSTIYIAMVAAAEESGSLPAVFGELERMLEQQDKIQKQLSSAMIYPIFLLSFCTIVIIGLFSFVIPSLRELLEGRELHPFTQCVIGLSDWFAHNTWTFILSLVSLVSLLVVALRSDRGRALWDALTLKLPIVGTMRTQSMMVKFTRTFSVLLANGVSVVKALEMASKVVGHKGFEDSMVSAKERLIEGKKLSEIFSEEKLVPSLVVRMIGIAEQTASLDKMLGNIAGIYQEDLDKSIKKVSTLIQPIMILLLGCIVGIVLLAVLLPLTDVSSFLN